MSTAVERAIQRRLDDLSSEEKGVAYRHLLRQGFAERTEGWFLVQARHEWSATILIHVPDVDYYRAIRRWLLIRTDKDPWPRERIVGILSLSEWFGESVDGEHSIFSFTKWVPLSVLAYPRVRHTFGKKVCQKLLEDWQEAGADPARLNIARKYFEEADDWGLPFEEIGPPTIKQPSSPGSDAVSLDSGDLTVLRKPEDRRPES